MYKSGGWGKQVKVSCDICSVLMSTELLNCAKPLLLSTTYTRYQQFQLSIYIQRNISHFLNATRARIDVQYDLPLTLIHASAMLLWNRTPERIASNVNASLPRNAFSSEPCLQVQYHLHLTAKYNPMSY